MTWHTNKYTQPLTAERNVWLTGPDWNGQELSVEVRLLPKEEWGEWEIVGDRLIIGTHENVAADHLDAYPGVEFHALHYTCHSLTDLPNDLVAAGDLERLGIQFDKPLKSLALQKGIVGSGVPAALDAVQAC
jgi:hypothetical protein